MPVQVLVVDDDALSRDVLSLLLQQAGYAVDAVESGDAALLHLQTATSAPQVVLTDLQMPGTTGRELAQRMRPLFSSAPLLLAMSATPPDDGSHHGFDGFLQKPFTMEALAAAIAGNISVPAAKASTTKENAKTAPLDEGIYRKLASSMRLSQLDQLYALSLSDAEARLETMRSSAADRDDAAYRREAHAIKGSCGMVGALELQVLATSMERDGLSDDHVASLDEFLVACTRLRRMLVAHKITQNRANEVSGEDV
jgi:CheY-like chemotaxis protein/HPt (histidine-containing phosphotransfer) domain-containing protein